jgi:NhaC family Na+:H+ antiporter
MEHKHTEKPSLFIALLPIIILIGLLFSSIFYIWGGDSLDGSNQMALLFSTAVALLIGWKLKFSWKIMFEGITSAIQSALPAMIILLLIGALSGTWLISGIVPTMIYYGLQILSPTYFLVSSVIICSIVSVATGSSWSTIATVGVALLGIGLAMEIHPGLIAGSIISGAYFGDKMSPMSDTTNLAPAVSGGDLFTHIRYMFITTVPTMILTLLIFLVIGFFISSSNNVADIKDILASLEGSFYINPVLFIVPAVVIFLIIKKVDAIPALFVGALLGGIFAIIFQPKVITTLGEKNNITIEGNGNEKFSYQWSDADGNILKPWHNEFELYNVNEGFYNLLITNESNEIIKASIFIPAPNDTSNSHFNVQYEEGFTVEDWNLSITHSKSNYLESSYRTLINAMTVDTEITTSNPIVNDLLSTGGMSGMLNTIWLIICAMCFGGAMERIGLLHKITASIVARAKTNGSLIASTALTCIGFNITASDQYLAIVVPGKMYAEEYKKRGLAPENLSRTLEDSGTVTSVLVPWNTCGAAQANVLGIATGDYMFYCFFNIISPLMTIIFGYLGIKIAKVEK